MGDGRSASEFKEGRGSASHLATHVELGPPLFGNALLVASPCVIKEDRAVFQEAIAHHFALAIVPPRAAEGAEAAPLLGLEPLQRDSPCCCSSRCTAERDKLPVGTVPAASSNRTVWRTERRGLARLACRTASCSAVASFDEPRSARVLGTSPSRPWRRRRSTTPRWSSRRGGVAACRGWRTRAR